MLEIVSMPVQNTFQGQRRKYQYPDKWAELTSWFFWSLGTIPGAEYMLSTGETQISSILPSAKESQGSRNDRCN
jgi:hypothetical protein